MADHPDAAILYALKDATWRIDGDKLVVDLRGPVHAADVALAMESVTGKEAQDD